MTEPVDPTPQTVVVTAPGDDVTLLIAGKSYGGWESVRITRGVERLPSDFELKLSDFYAAEADVLQVHPGDACVVKIGRDVVLTGYVDIVAPSYTKTSHEISVFGRGKCQDLVDCSAEWPKGQIVGSSVLEVARKLAAPYGITVSALDDPGGPIPRFSLMRGETPFEIIERLARFRQMLAYDAPDGNLVLARLSSHRHVSGLREGFNVHEARAFLSMHQRFSEYQSYLQAFTTFIDKGDAGDAIATFKDAGVTRHRIRMIVAETSGGGIGALDAAKDRAGWEAARRYGRSYAVRIVTDGWRDRGGTLYSPNYLIALDLPTCKITGKTWAISEVTYRKDEGGTLCDIVAMPKEAFLPQPQLMSQLPAEFAYIKPGSGGRP